MAKNRMFKDCIADNTIPDGKKINLIWEIAHLETLNGVTKDDLQAMLRWLVEHHYCIAEDGVTMAKEYIEREAAIKAIENDCLELVYYTKEDAIQCVKAIPAADVAPVVHGRWI